MKNSNENREMRRFASAIAMQSLVRGHFGRMVVKRRLKAKQLQAWYRGAHVRRVRKLNRCATIIQSTYRGHQGRKNMTRRSRLAFAVDTVLHQIKEHEMILNFVSNLVEKDEDIRTSLEQDDHLVLRRVRQIELYAESMQHAYKQVRSKRWSIMNDATLDSSEAGVRARVCAEESADSFVHEQKESHKSSLSMCSVLAGAPPEIPKPISSLRFGT